MAERAGSRSRTPSAAGVALIAGLGLATAAWGGAAGQSAEAVYSQQCAGCHGVAREGGFGPALSGVPFSAKWAPRGNAALSAYLRQSMPPSDPGSLSPGTSDALAGWLLGAVGRTAAPDPAPAKADASPKIVGLGEASANHDRIYDAAVAARQRRLAALTEVSDAALRNPPAGDWLAPRRTDDNFGFSPLAQIDRSNVARLQLAWSLALPAGTNEITPLAHDGVLFVNSSGTVLAIDGASGEVLWTFRRPAEAAQPAPPISQPRGMALWGTSLIVPTIDNHVIALDMRTGRPIWDTAVAPGGGRLKITGAPIVAAGKVVLGVSGCGLAGNCFVVAVDAATGKESWRFATIAKAGTKDGDSWAGLADADRFGGSVWGSPSYDPATGLVYVGVGQSYNIAPLMASGRSDAANAALYTDSTLALDAATGRLAWHYQHMARDVWDLDWSFERMVVTLPTPQGPRRAVATMGKLGILDVLDARTGAYLFSHDLRLQTLVTAIDPTTGHKRTDPALEPDLARAKTICPFATGVRNWPATSFDPGRGLLFVPFLDACMDFVWKPGGGFDIAYTVKPRPASNGSFGGLAAIDLAGRRTVWTERFRGPAQSSALATAGGIVFVGGRDRTFRASDSASGRMLWQVTLDQIASSSPMAFTAGGQQRIAVVTGGGNPNDVTTRLLTPEVKAGGAGVRLWVLGLPQAK